MKHEVILVIGGARSGKSTWAEQLACVAGERRYYIATCPVLDAEMADRVARHRRLRGGANWTTIEEQTELENALERAAAAGAESILVDCLTLWINNLLFHDPDLDEAGMARRAESLAACLQRIPGTTVLVINEVGLGLVPESPLARRFRDLSGRCAQILAAAADRVYLTVAGIAQKIK